LGVYAAKEEALEMDVFADKVAVVTGAASGIGRGIAERCAQEGMKVVLAGINQGNLDPVEEALRANGTEVLSVETDVSKLSDIEALAQRTMEVFGAIHLLVNNAGVAGGGPVWECNWGDWEWVMGVNLWGVIYAAKVFVPLMLTQDADSHIVNVSSIAGVLPYHPAAPYQVTKHAVVALSENLHYSLLARNAPVGVSVLCPGWVKTRIMESGRNRPPDMPEEPVAINPVRQAIIEEFRQKVEGGLTPQKVADDVFRGIRDKELYIFTETEHEPMVRSRVEHILGSFDRL
jgi:NAD(P)-dependent dehydrogenase (short-subunit alcohol dehydrogenase family)